MKPRCALCSHSRKCRRWWSPTSLAARTVKRAARRRRATLIHFLRCPMRTSSTHQEEAFTMMNTPDITQHYEAITALLSTEEAAPPVSHLADWEAQQVRRAALTEHTQQLELAVAQVQRR